MNIDPKQIARMISEDPDERTPGLSGGNDILEKHDEILEAIAGGLGTIADGFAEIYATINDRGSPSRGDDPRKPSGTFTIQMEELQRIQDHAKRLKAIINVCLGLRLSKKLP